MFMIECSPIGSTTHMRNVGHTNRKMRKIYFEKLDGLTNKLVAIPMLIAFGVYFYTAFNLSDSIYHKISAIIAFGLASVFLGKQFFFRNYIGWNKLGIVIKLNSFWSKTLSFKKIELFDFNNDFLEIRLGDGTEFSFRLANIKKEDVERLKELLKTNTITDRDYPSSLPQN